MRNSTIVAEIHAQEAILQFTVTRSRCGADMSRSSGLSSSKPIIMLITGLIKTFNGTWTQGNQKGLDSLPGRNADCGQSAAGNVSGDYMVGSIHSASHQEQPLAVRTPAGFDPFHGLQAQTFPTWPRPANAQAVAYYNLVTGGFHYARFEENGLVHTDANRAQEPGMGGTYAVFGSRPRVGAQPSLSGNVRQRGVQPSATLADTAAFVAYCQNTYGLGPAQFFFCRFG